MQSVCILKDQKEEEEREGYFHQDDEGEAREEILCKNLLKIKEEEEEKNRLYPFNGCELTLSEEILVTFDSPYYYFCCTNVCDMVKCSVPMCDKLTPQCALHVGKSYCIECHIIIEKLGTKVEPMLKNPLYCQLCYHKISRKGSIAYCNKGCYLGRKKK